MSGERIPPQARDRTLGAQLRAIRKEQTSLSLERAAEAAQVSLATLSRTENGKRHITSEDVAALLAIYRVPPDQRAAMIEAAKASDQAGWWQRPLPGVLPDVGTLASHESAAHALTDWSITMIPGLLQSRDYAAGVMVATGTDPGDVENRWNARMRRQQVLPRVDYTAYIHEMVFYTQFGGVDAFKAQMLHLHDASTRGLGVRIVRARVPLGALVHSWMLLEFPKDHPVVHVELLQSAVYLHVPEVKVYEDARHALAGVALSTAESRTMIEKLTERL